MATVNPVIVRLMPGIQSIRVTYKNSPDDPQWLDYNEGQRIGEGVIVKFEVTLYPEFTLTSWRAYYSDAYGTIIDLTLSPITGESAWTFEMADSGVVILCEAESTGIPGEITWPSYSSDAAQRYDVVANASFIQVCEKLLSLMPTGMTFLNHYTPEGLASYILSFADNNTIEKMSYQPNGSLFKLTCCQAFNNRNYNALEIRLIILWGQAWPSRVTAYVTNRPNTTTLAIYSSNAGNTGDPVGVHVVAQGDNINGYTRNEYYKGTYYHGPESGYGGIYEVYAASGLMELPGPGIPGKVSIRYIMSPDNSGELIIGHAPGEIDDGITSFTFKWRHKVNYDLRRITSFAVGSGASETSIPNSYTYDGETRTYTVTVSDIISSATGIRVLIETIVINDPNNAGGTNDSSGPIGGDGTYDDSSDSVPLPAIPSGISVADSGFVTLFRPTLSQVKQLGNYLWSNISDFIENLQKIFTNPMDYFIAFNIMPVTPSVGSDKTIYIGNWLTNISMPVVQSQFYEFNCGTIQVQPYFDTFLDYAPNTTARIMLPFIGDRDLAINEIMGKTLHLWYRIDLLSGACVAILTVNNDTYYQWSGNCAVGIPVTGSDWSRLYSGIARVATIGAATAAFGFGGAMTATTITNNTSGVSQANSIANLGRSFSELPAGVAGVRTMRGAITGASENIKEPETRIISSQSSRAINGMMLGNIFGYNMMSAIPRVQHTGDMSGAISIMGNRTPYIVLEYPNVNLPSEYKHLFGYPSNQYATLGNLSGFTKCRTVMFESTSATDDEIEMIITALKGGVYL